MGILPILIGWPLLIAAIVPLIKQERIRGYVVYAGAGGCGPSGHVVDKWRTSDGVLSRDRMGQLPDDRRGTLFDWVDCVFEH